MKLFVFALNVKIHIKVTVQIKLHTTCVKTNLNRTDKRKKIILTKLLKSSFMLDNKNIFLPTINSDLAVRVYVPSEV